MHRAPIATFHVGWLKLSMKSSISMSISCSMREVETRGYVLAIYPQDYGWVALMPDFRGATGRDVEMESAILRAIQAARKVCSAMIEVGRVIPAPSEISSVKTDPIWSRLWRRLVESDCAHSDYGRTDCADDEKGDVRENSA
jgi:predicted RNase H-like HicB family nuclease